MPRISADERDCTRRFGALSTPIAEIRSAVTPKSSELANVKAVLRKLAIKVVDCRSGAPVVNTPVEKVLIADPGQAWDDKAHAAVRFFGDFSWDLVENYIIPYNEATGQPASATGFTSTDRSKLQVALTALGYNCGTAGKTFTDEDWTALEAYESDWYAAHPSETRPDKFVREVTKPWIARIVGDYNRRFFETLQMHLTGLGYECPESEFGTFGAVTAEKFATWQKVELGSKVPYTRLNTWDNYAARRTAVGKLQERRKMFSTNDDGIVYVPVPVTKIILGFRLKVQFRDFPVLLERQGYRPFPVVEPLPVTIEWADTTQDKAAGPWGWRYRVAGNKQPAAALPEFRSFIEAAVPGVISANWKDLSTTERIIAGFSPWFSLFKGHPEMVALAMVWAPPVWDGIPDPSPAFRITDKVYVEEGSLRRAGNMHIVTRAGDGAGSENYGNKGYGKLDHSNAPLWRGDDGHYGLDIHAAVGAKVFAIHGGQLERKSQGLTVGAGQYIALSFAHNGRSYRWTSFHFSAYGAPAGAVMAGEILGYGGRTGNMDPAGGQGLNPGHTHVESRDLLNRHEMRLASEVDAANAVCIPTNQTALLFPCRGENFRSADEADNPRGCRFAKTNVVNGCWAVAELACPYMHGTTRDNNRRLQAQLRYVFETYEGGFTDPGKLDGDIGTVPKKIAGAGKTRLAIRNFRIQLELTKEDAPETEGWEMDDAAWLLLDDWAAILQPETAPTD